MSDFDLVPIGFVVSDLASTADAPGQTKARAPLCEIEFIEHYRDALRQIRAGDRLLLLTWLYRTDRTGQIGHAHSDTARTPMGVFSTRSPHLPNPIGLHKVEVVCREDLILTVDPLEAADNTPIIDLRSVFGT